MKKFLSQLKTYFFRGLLAIIPIALSFFAVRFLYLAIDKKIMVMIERLIGVRIPGLGILLLTLSLCLLGLIASNVIGKQVFHLLERISSRIPLIRTTYQVGKQLASVLSLPEQNLFKRVVLVDYLKPGIWTIGFVTATITDQNTNETLLKVFIPTPPNPTSGTMVVVKESEARDPGWTIEQALKTVISGGIIGPSEIKKGFGKYLK